MTKTIHAHDLSSAWVSSLEHLVMHGGKDTNVIVVIEQIEKEIPPVRQFLEDFIVERNQHMRKSMYPVTTVANTLFPQSLYNPQRKNARAFLYQKYEQSFPVISRLRANSYGTYFYRMMACPGKNGNVNQLENIIHRLQSELRRPNPLSSAYEIGVSEVGDADSDGAIAEDIRVYLPGCDNRSRGFPCLSHISLTLFEKRLHLTALYRNQHFIERAYGNYMGLSRLLRFLCQEVGCEPGELVCIASHADAQLDLGKRAVTLLVQQCKSALPIEYSRQAS